MTELETSETLNELNRSVSGVLAECERLVAAAGAFLQKYLENLGSKWEEEMDEARRTVIEEAQVGVSCANERVQLSKIRWSWIIEGYNRATVHNSSSQRVDPVLALFTVQAVAEEFGWFGTPPPEESLIARVRADVTRVVDGVLRR